MLITKQELKQKLMEKYQGKEAGYGYVSSIGFFVKQCIGLDEGKRV